MAKFYGVVGFDVSGIEGFEVTTQYKRGVTAEVYHEQYYSGDVIRNTRSLQADNKVNEDISISNQISIIADPFVTENFHAIRYVKYMGTAWRVTSVEVQYPRLILSLGGVFNV